MQLSPQEMNIKGKTRKGIKLLGGLEAAAMVLDVEKSALSNYQNTNKPACFIPLNIAMQMDDAIGQPLMAEALMDAFKSRFNEPDNPHKLLANLNKEAGECGSALSLALEDGEIDRREADEVYKEAADLKQSAENIMQMTTNLQVVA